MEEAIALKRNQGNKKAKLEGWSQEGREAEKKSF